MKFEVSGTRYEFDPAPESLMGDEVIALEENLPPGWADRWAALELGVLDVVMLTYLAAKRAGEQRPYSEFVKTIAPLTFKPLPAATAAAPNPASAAAPTAPTAPTAPPDAIGPVLRTRKTRAKTTESSASS